MWTLYWVIKDFMPSKITYLIPINTTGTQCVQGDFWKILYNRIKFFWKKQQQLKCLTQQCILWKKFFWFLSFMTLSVPLSLFRRGLFGTAYRWRGKKRPLPLNLLHISYNYKTWYRYILPEEDLKEICKSRDILLEFCLHQHFFESLKTVLINMVAILMMSQNWLL